MTGDPTKIVPQVLAFLKAFYWILTDFLEQLSSFKGSPEQSVRLHLEEVRWRLAGLRRRIGETLQMLDVPLTERPKSEEIYSSTGLIGREVSERFEECLRRLEGEYFPSRDSILANMRTFIEAGGLVIKMVRAYQKMLEGSGGPLEASLKSIAWELESLIRVRPKP